MPRSPTNRVLVARVSDASLFPSGPDWLCGTGSHPSKLDLGSTLPLAGLQTSENIYILSFLIHKREHKDTNLAVLVKMK